MKYTKPHLSFEKQTDLLASRGLIIEDRSLSVRILSQISYYRLSAYCIPFQDQKDHFTKGVKFDDIVQLHNFDHELRVIVFNSLEFIEVALRTLMTYYLSKVYGPFGYANPINFSTDFKHSEWFTNIEDEISRSRENFITHYRIKYTESEYFPIWMATEVFSFGSLSKLYRGLQFKDKKIIAEQFQIHAPVFQSWLHCLVYLRNLCAHHSRLWNRELAIQPQLPKKDPRWQIPVEIRNNRIFCLLTILHYCFRVLGTVCPLKNQIETLLKKYPNIPLLSMGMYKDWSEHSLWTI